MHIKEIVGGCFLRNNQSSSRDLSNQFSLCGLILPTQTKQLNRIVGCTPSPLNTKRSFTSLHTKSRLDYKTYDETIHYAIKRTNITATHFQHKIV